MSEADAAKVLGQVQANGILLPDVLLEMDNQDLGTVTVGDVLADLGRFGADPITDPIEGIGYGRCKAKVMRGRNGEPFINSFAHGGTIYKLLRSMDAANSVAVGWRECTARGYPVAEPPQRQGDDKCYGHRVPVRRVSRQDIDWISRQ